MESIGSHSPGGWSHADMFCFVFRMTRFKLILENIQPYSGACTFNNRGKTKMMGQCLSSGAFDTMTI